MTNDALRPTRWIALQNALTGARATYARFPVVVIAAIACAIVALIMVDSPGGDRWDRRLAALTLALPLCFALTLLGERWALTRGRRIALSALGLLPVLLFYLALRNWSDAIAFTRYAHFNLSLHLLVAFIPFVFAGTLRGFWQYNRSLFLRFLLATLYTLVLFAGLSVALLALDNLFGVSVRGRMYEQLFIVLGFVFHPWFFLAGVPADIEALDRLDDYPIGLKVFAQFVLIPLVTVYLLILTAYLVRVVITTTWPGGWIGWLVSSVAAAGTLALLLVHPTREREDSRWVDAFGRWFYVALLPSIAMLLMAVWLRIDQYGFTEQRYLLAVLALWLAGIAVYFGVTGSRNIKAIPLTLCIVGLATLVGPWSAYAVSARSQVHRFQDILERNEMLVDGRVRAADGTNVSLEDGRELSAVLRYLVRTHGAKSLARIDPMFADTTVIAVADPTRIVVDEPHASRVMERLGLSYVNQWQTSAVTPFYHQAEPFGQSIDIEGFESMMHADIRNRTAIAVDPDSLVVGPLETDTLRVRWQGQTIDIASVDSMRARIDRAGPAGPASYGLLQSLLTVDAELDGLRMRILFRTLAGQVEDGRVQVHTALADILLDRR
ncbi:MAG: DUF4153 domain-containing protein [Longimicrobiales bacterium]